MKLLSVAFMVVLLNLPFGYWRANVRKFSLAWFLSVHAPVPFVIALRIVSGLGWQLATFPIMVSAYFIGQFAGSKLHAMRSASEHATVTSCLIRDLVARGKRSRSL